MGLPKAHSRGVHRERKKEMLGEGGGRARDRMGTEMQGQREAGGQRGRGRGDREEGVEGGLGVQEKEREGNSGRWRERILSHLNLASRSSDTKLGKGPPQ